jgi:hypothetical protein
LKKYENSYIEENYVYSFDSQGVKGTILKLVAFQPMNLNEYNLALLDYDIENQVMNDTIVSNNQDMPMILATVINIIADFLKFKSDCLVFIIGNSEIRQKLYNRVVRNNLNDLTELYSIKGVLESGDVELFSNVFKDYVSIIIEKK